MYILKSNVIEIISVVYSTILTYIYLIIYLYLYDIIYLINKIWLKLILNRTFLNKKKKKKEGIKKSLHGCCFL